METMEVNFNPSVNPPNGLGDSENPQLENFLVLIDAILNGRSGGLGSLNAGDPQTAFILTMLAKLVTNSSFLSDLSSGTTTLDKQLEAALNDTSYGPSILQDCQAILNGGTGEATAISHLLNLIGAKGSGINTFLNDINQAGLNYSFSGSNGSQFQQDMWTFAGRFAGILGSLGDALKQGNLGEAQDAALLMSDYINGLYADAQANPNDPLSILILSILTTAPVEANGKTGDSIYALMQEISQTRGGTPNSAALQELYNELNGSGGDFSIASILQCLTNYWPNNFLHN